jgi:hypothetical protein
MIKYSKWDDAGWWGFKKVVFPNAPFYPNCASTRTTTTCARGMFPWYFQQVARLQFSNNACAKMMPDVIARAVSTRWLLDMYRACLTGRLF